ncbi:prokaryotic molybdopterin-containing oxidoreductase family, membrane subunit [Halobiforma haloterrestris]|uniref:Prokaryotic molybdopterin-containing oxidoreductase family, membrane subunit n=1 Tax=Natronobacterium haloterrestre TaxID=148448 RepID=A0A1I1EFJ5_NATHA|nr:NrfD/PsrC family molybdoenzyme membrane anchor subunit [Halobiforma haloterrestris]SFB84088.1 prokaryotic molybdopterin-containing oxidoreductase family, membrane subunit [Halobiforma haloterrestris]
MSTKEPREADILRPIQTTSTKYYAAVAIAGLALLVFLVGWAYQLWEGLVVTGLADWGTGGGVTWGIYIGAFIWWVGIAHGGIILSAAVRLLGMERYMPVARLAEMLTLAGLSAAGFYIIVHMGRPDRMVTSVLGHYHITVHNSPLVWDVTVITAYFVLTATYLGLTLRYDVTRLRDELPDHFGPIYSIMTIGYTEKEDEIVQRMVWWLALAIIIMAPLLLHGGVIPWLFAVLPTYPRWFGGVQGPQFLTIALTSAISGVIILSYGFRRAYDWEHIITDDIFRGLTLWLGFFSLLFLWLQLQQVTTGTFFPPVELDAAWHATLEEIGYLISMSLVLIVLAYIFAQTIRPTLFTKGRALLCAVAVLSATLTEKVLFVVEGFLHPAFEIYGATPGTYVPSLIELSSITGTIGMVALFFLSIAKVVPVVELHAIEHLRAERDEEGSHD